MFKPIKSLLFATNLSENCRPALEASIAIAAQHSATLVLFHVIDREVPGQIEDHFISLLGEEKWEAIKKGHEEDAQRALSGKMTTKSIAQSVMQLYGEEAGIEDLSTHVVWEGVVVGASNIADAIVEQARHKDCGLIVLGSRKGFLGANAIGSKMKDVLRKSKIPVMVVPSRSE